MLWQRRCGTDDDERHRRAGVTPAPPETDRRPRPRRPQRPRSAPPTTEAPTTTLDPTAALIADIEADLNAGEQALIAAGADPSTPVCGTTCPSTSSATGLDRVNEFLDGLVRDGLVDSPESRRS